MGESVQRRLEVGQQCEEVMNEAEETMKKLMAPRELMFTEALIPMCYHHWEGTWDVCDYVIWRVCWRKKGMEWLFVVIDRRGVGMIERMQQ